MGNYFPKCVVTKIVTTLLLALVLSSCAVLGPTLKCNLSSPTVDRLLPIYCYMYRP